MIRIYIKWDFISPSLRVASGILYVDDVEAGRNNRNIFKCKVKVEDGSLGYSSIKKDGIPSNLFENIKHQIDLMTRSFFSGVILRNYCYHWLSEPESENFLNLHRKEILERK